MNVSNTITRHEPEILRLGLQIYNPSFEADNLLLRWWLALVETGDIERLIIKGSRKLSAFFDIFRPPTVTVYTCNLVGEIEFIMWLRPASTATDERTVFISNWSSVALRGTRRQLDLTFLVYSMTFTLYDHAASTTWQPRMAHLLHKLGYHTTGTLPGAYGQKIIYIMHLNKIDFYNSKFFTLYTKRRNAK